MFYIMEKEINELNKHNSKSSLFKNEMNLIKYLQAFLFVLYIYKVEIIFILSGEYNYSENSFKFYKNVKHITLKKDPKNIFHDKLHFKFHTFGLQKEIIFWILREPKILETINENWNYFIYNPNKITATERARMRIEIDLLKRRMSK